MRDEGLKGGARRFGMHVGEVAAYALAGTAAGLFIGAAVGIFGLGVEHFSGLGASHFSLYVWFLPLAGLFRVFMLRRWGG